ncbi:hypothetical protein PG996_011184 [Apiospora saccharicola]|uniref:protein-ribulosamine 3-kinase n=1 Tax=Apiospora saccharicola TaxID=335842 RepID=A0ABR1UEW1_9PEZI
MGPTDKAVWDQEIPVPQSTISYVDEAIKKVLPSGLQIKSIFPSGASYWARTAKIEAVDADGNEDSFFVKVHQGDHGKTMVSAECEAMEALYKLIPEMVAKPIAWGSFEDIPDTHFFVCKYHEMSEDIPDITDFPALVAEFHKRSAAPDGKFGYPNPTFGGKNPQNFPPSDTWEECFRKGMEGIFAAELETHGPDKEWERLTKLTLEKTIPRLLCALEADGRKIVPRLVHGDLWEGNCSVDVNTGAPMIFDSTPLYAHNEYELGPWLCPRHRFPPYIDEYTKHFPVSAPTEEFGDRIELYCLRFDVHASSLYPGNLRFRSIAQETMKKLVEKYQLDEASSTSVPNL